MKQIELELTITNTLDNKWEIIVYPKRHKEERLASWFKGDTKAEALERFYKGMSEPCMKYWFMMEEK